MIFENINRNETICYYDDGRIAATINRHADGTYVVQSVLGLAGFNYKKDARQYVRAALEINA